MQLSPNSPLKLRRALHVQDMQNPMLAKLWSKSKAPRIAKMAEPQYAEHVGNSADPYNVTERSDVILKLGNVALDPNRPSAIFVSSVVSRSW